MVSEQFNPVIFDLGSSTVRAGWAGHDQPKIVESSFLGLKSDGGLDPIPLRFLNGKRPSEPSDVVVTQQYDPESLEWTLSKECLAPLAETIMFSQRGLQANAMERPLFATCPSGVPVSFKRAYYEHFMEGVQVPAFFLGDSSVLSMYAVGRVSGVCVDVGASATTIARVEKGQIADLDIYSAGGNLIDIFILSRVEGLSSALPGFEATESFIDQYRLALAREVKHNACKCSHHALPALPVSPPATRASRGGRSKTTVLSPSGHAMDPVRFKLPDGSEVDVAQVQEHAAEQLFVQQGDFPGLPTALAERLNPRESDRFVMLTGGAAHFHGFHSRLVHEVEVLTGSSVNMFPFNQWTHRNHSAFVGASILASLSSFGSMWVTPASFRENGIERLLADNI